ncbi:MAG: hotdog fold thioesterase [Syntrophomonadaceae bacterium]
MSELPKFDFTHTVMGALGIEMTQMKPEKVIATMPVTPKTHQPFGVMHGGVSVVLAETVASAGSYLFINREKQRAVGLEINANHIRGVSSGVVRAEGVPVHVGRTTLVWDIRIYDDSERLVCISRCTIAVIERTDI